MTDRLVLYHNPACSKSRGALEILRERLGGGGERGASSASRESGEGDAGFDVVEYLKSPLTEADLRAIIGMIDEPAADLVRKDGHFRELGLAAADYASEDSVVKLLLEHPKLMQRPVAVRGGRALIARPSEKVEELL